MDYLIVCVGVRQYLQRMSLAPRFCVNKNHRLMEQGEPNTDYEMSKEHGRFLFILDTEKSKVIWLKIYSALVLFLCTATMLSAQKIGMIRDIVDDMTGDVIKETIFCPLDDVWKVKAKRFNSSYTLTFVNAVTVTDYSGSLGGGTVFMTSKEYVILKFSDGSTIKLYHKPDNKYQQGLTYIFVDLSMFSMEQSLDYAVDKFAYRLLISKPVVKIRFYARKSNPITNNSSLKFFDRDIPTARQKTMQFLFKAI